MAPMFAEANRYWCNGTEWPDCKPAVHPTVEPIPVACKCREQAFEAAQAALAAVREPSEAMVEAAYSTINAGAFTSYDVISEQAINETWQAMIDAALQKPPGGA